MNPTKTNGDVRSRRRRGAAMVEMCIAFPLLVWITYAIIQYAVILNTEESLNDLSRQCARFAAVYYYQQNFNSNASTTGSIQTYLKQQCAASFVNYSDLPNCPSGKQQPCVGMMSNGQFQELSNSVPEPGQSIAIELYQYPMSKKIYFTPLVPGLSYFNTNVTLVQSMMAEPKE